MINQLEQTLIDEIEIKNDLVRGELRTALSHLWKSLRDLINKPEMNVVEIKNWGTYYPHIQQVENRLKKLIRIHRHCRLVGVVNKYVDKEIAELFLYRRILIKRGDGAKRHYKKISHGKVNSINPRVGGSAKILRERIRRIREARHERRKRAESEWGGKRF